MQKNEVCFLVFFLSQQYIQDEYMPVAVESGFENRGIQLIRTVVDTVQQCNLRCAYCHPGLTWKNSTLPASRIEDVLGAAESKSLFEVTLSGGEITLHDELDRILDATHVLDRTVSTLITNATRITPEITRQMRDSNLGRICVSVDGPEAATHNSARGKTFDKVMDGLKQLQESGKPIIVISVAHHENYGELLSLSEKLAENGLASQHHMCSPSYSGEARKNYGRLRLRENEYHELQGMIDQEFLDLQNQGLYVTFNSYWPATGERSKVDKGREITLVQLTEQLKDCYVIVRSNGDFRLTAAAWGRETVGNAVIGNLHTESAGELYQRADDLYREGSVRQLPRAVEAMHKFHYGRGDDVIKTDMILDNKAEGPGMVEMIPFVPLSESDVLQRELTDEVMDQMVGRFVDEPGRYRLVKNPSGVHILFDRVTTHVTLLQADEVTALMGKQDRMVLKG